MSRQICFLLHTQNTDQKLNGQIRREKNLHKTSKELSIKLFANAMQCNAMQYFRHSTWERGRECTTSGARKHLSSSAVGDWGSMSFPSVVKLGNVTGLDSWAAAFAT
jgi:hypothetical protein